MSRERDAEALFVAPDAFFTSRRVQLATLAARDKIPAAYAQLPSYRSRVPVVARLPWADEWCFPSAPLIQYVRQRVLAGTNE
jgi:hypothetical protein